MTYVRSLLLACAAALTAMAIAAGAAHAQEAPIEVLDEATGAHCNPCIGHAVGSATLTSHVFGHEELASQCDVEVTGEIYEDGTGHSTQQSLTGPNCTQQACDSASEAEWTVIAVGETGPDVGHATTEFCLEPAGGGTERHCLIEGTGTRDPVEPHRGTTSDEGSCPISPGVSLEISGSGTSEGADMEVVHL